MTISELHNNNVNIKQEKKTDCTKLRQAIRDAAKANFLTKGERDKLLLNVGKNPELSEIKIKKYLCSGASAVVFETESGDILKITEGSHYPLGRKPESFDVPIKKSGKSGDLCFYIEEKLLQYGMSEGFIDIIKDEIRKRGYKPHDLDAGDLHQIGISKDGKLYLIDPECAIPKSIFHALWYKLTKRA